MLTIQEALRELELLENNRERQNTSDKYIVHFTNTFENLAEILRTKIIKVGVNDTVSFTKGFSNITGLPLQYLRSKNYWNMGIQLIDDKEKFNLKDYSDIKKAITDSINKTDLIQISDLLLLDNGDCWICVTARELPIHISPDFYNYLRKVLQYQSSDFMNTHKMSDIEIPTKFSYIEKSYKQPIKIKDALQFRTAKSNHGVYITANPDFKITGMANGTTYYLGRRKPWHHEISAKEYIDKIERLNKEIDDAGTKISEISDKRAKTQQDLDRISQKLINFNKAEGQIRFNNLKKMEQDLQTQVKSLTAEIENLNDSISQNSRILQTDLTRFSTSKSQSADTIGGAPIYIQPEFIDELVDSISLDEREVISDGDFYFTYSDLDSLYFPMKYFISNYEFNLEDYCDQYPNLKNASDYIIKIKNNKTDRITPEQIEKFNNSLEVQSFLNSLQEILALVDIHNINLILYDKTKAYSIR